MVKTVQLAAVWTLHCVSANTPLSDLPPTTYEQAAQLCVTGTAGTPYVNGRIAIAARYGIALAAIATGRGVSDTKNTLVKNIRACTGERTEHTGDGAQC